MSALEFHSFLSKRPPVISDSARQLSYRFGVAVTTVTNNLDKAGYVKTSLGYELPSEERPVTVLADVEQLKEILAPFIRPQSLIMFTQEQREKLLAQEHTNEKFVELLLKQLAASNISTAKILRLAIAFHFFDPSNESFTVQ